MDEATSALEGFQLCDEITEQGKSCKEVTEQYKVPVGYEDLSVELKEMIWKYTFPGSRHITFALPPFIRRNIAQTGDPPLPIALHVCRISRKTMLAEYQIVYQHHRPYYYEYRKRRSDGKIPLFPVYQHRPVCFNPKIDQFSMEANEMLDYRNATGLSKVVHEFPGCLDGIEVLEVHGVVWICDETFPDMDKYQRYEYGSLNLFRNLKELHMVSSSDWLPCGERSGLMATRAAYEKITKWYEKARDLDPEICKRNVPKVMFHCYRPKQVMSDELRRDWERLYVADSEDPDLDH